MMDDRSYECPSQVTTASVMTDMVIGHLSSSLARPFHLPVAGSSRRHASITLRSWLLRTSALKASFRPVLCARMKAVIATSGGLGSTKRTSGMSSAFADMTRSRSSRS